MDGGRTESSIWAPSGTVVEDGDGSSYYHNCYTRRKGRPCGKILSSSFFSVLSCIIILLALGGVGNEGVGLATASVTIPVSRSFSKLKGSGMADGESGGMTLEHAKQLRDHDYQRHFGHHGRVLTSKDVGEFPLAGSEQIGLYYTEIQLGTPSNKYYVQVDTGSDLLWVKCTPCASCPPTSDLNITLRLYDPSSSKTSSTVSCSSSMCNEASKILQSSCDSSGCQYGIVYGDRSTTQGYLVDDTLTYATGAPASANNTNYNQTSATVTFGCSDKQTGQGLTQSGGATDGIMGFGQSGLSVVSQLVSQGLTPNAFAHCLQGDTGKGGIFVIGDVNEPGIVYTGIVSNQFHYNVVLQSISMNGKNLNIAPSVFDAGAIDTGTIFDSGTTMAIIVDEAYDAFEKTLLDTAPVKPEYNGPQPCFSYNESDVESAFPSVTLQFQGAAMNLHPSNYLYSTLDARNDSVWCLGWFRGSDVGLEGLTILGDIVLKNKLVVYDLAKARIGWVDYDCQSSVVAVSVSEAAMKLRNPLGFSGPHSLWAYLAVLIGSTVFLHATALQ